MDPFITAALLLITILFVAATKLGRRGTRRHNLPPGSYGWPILGESLDLIRANRDGDSGRFVRERVEKYRSHVFRTHVLGEPVAVVGGPAGNKLLFSNEGKAVVMSWPKSVYRLIGPSMITKTGDEGKAHKKLVMSFFNMEMAKSIPTMDEVTRLHLATQWQGEGELKVYPTIKQYAFKLACRLFMSITEPELVMRLFDHFNIFLKGVISTPLNFPGTSFSRGARAADAIREELRAVVRQRRADLEGKVASPTQDLLSYLLSNTDDNGKFLPEVEVINNMLNLLFAGHDTTTSTITLVVKYLAELPRVHEKVFAEQREIRASKEPGEFMKREDLQRMRYSWNVVSEVMRMTSPVAGGFREALVDIEFEGYTIPKGWKMLWSASYTHKDPEFHPKANEFDESRFEGSGPAPFAYVPFGGGPRMCLGMEFARLQILLFLHNLVNQFNWDLSIPDEKIVYDPMPTPVRGLPIRLRPRV